MIPPPLKTVTESSEIKIIWGIHIFQTNFEKDLSGSFLRDSISMGAHWFLGMVYQTSVVGIPFIYSIRLVNIAEILLLWHGVVCPDDSALGQVSVCVWKVHSTMTDPENIPVVSIW